MAEKQFALGGTRSVGFQEEDDPLAELARIVGFQEPASSPAPSRAEDRREPVITEFPVAPAQGAAAVSTGQNPVADLEDELLRAFETYDAPAITPAQPKAPEAMATQPVVTAPQAAVSRHSSLDDEDPFAALAAVVAQAEAVSRPVATRAPEPVQAPAPRQPVEPAFAPAPVVASVAEEEPAVDFSVEQLEAELLQSLDEAELDWNSQAAPVSQPAPAVRQDVTAPAIAARTDFRMPMANFHSATAAPLPRPVQQPIPRTEPVAWDLPGDAADDLTATAATQRAIEPASAGRADPVFGASLAAISGMAKDAPVVQPASIRSPELDFSETVGQAADEPDFAELFREGEFELDLDDFEHQLTQVAEVEHAAVAPLAQASEPRRSFADFVPESASHASYEAPRAVREPDFEPVDFSKAYEEKPVQVRFETTPAAPAPMPQAPSFNAAGDAPEFDNSLFDPAMLSETEDPVEAVEDFDVPEIKMPEPEAPAVVVPDYDLDIDAEMANLFSGLPPLGAGEREKQPAMADHGVARADAAAPASARSQPISVESFDDFERALEEDFRSMLSQPLGLGAEQAPRGPAPQMVSVAPPRNNNFRSILLAACATGAVALIGLGGYFVFSGKSSIIASGEPKTILADKGPVKVVPENKGGVTVPNQDKAVYDRVAGNSDETVKQGALITSEEEPVDVVQKTLMPENNEDMAMAEPAVPTPVEDTKDARLLPAADKQDGGDAASGAPGGVQVRKVRTMIVKADGSLVPREEEPKATDAASAPEAQAPAGETTAAVPQDRIAPATDDAAATADALAAVANTPVAEKAPDGTEVPVNPVKTSKLADTAPVPTARPAEQPVNVVGTVTENGKVKPASTEAAAEQQTASIDPAAAQPVAAPASGSYGIQIASLPTEADAKASIGKMSAKFGGVLGGRPIGIRQANIPNKGTYFRLRVDVGSKEQAIALCTKLKAAGGSCLVSK